MSCVTYTLKYQANECIVMIHHKSQIKGKRDTLGKLLCFMHSWLDEGKFCVNWSGGFASADSNFSLLGQ